MLLNLINIFSLSLSTPIQNSDSFDIEKADFYKENSYTNEQFENEILNYDSFRSFDENAKMLNKSGGSSGVAASYVSDGIKASNLRAWLNSNYPVFSYWAKKDNASGLTSDVTGAIPIEMRGSKANGFLFPDEDIHQALANEDLLNFTSYGGCGPIALMGIFDYFSRYLGYDLSCLGNSYNTDTSDSRIALASFVLRNTNFSIFNVSEDATFVWPSDCANCFNCLIENFNLGHKICAKSNFKFFGGNKEEFWNQIVYSVDKGIPVTLATGLTCGSGYFSEHYTNIYGYETWEGVSSDGQKITKRFVKARLNWGMYQEYYCDADILDCSQIGLITYDVTYYPVSYINAYDFRDLVNDSGEGQYFFNEKVKTILTDSGDHLTTRRLRTSYIENKYLVLSPNRKNAGDAYLDIAFSQVFREMVFSINLWGPNEGSLNEKFKIYYFSSVFNDFKTIECKDLSTSKTVPNQYRIVFPKQVYRVKFEAIHSSPSGEKNRGRICLDNFYLSL